MYYLIYCPLYLLSLLPLRVLYLLGDAVYGLLYYVVGYRRKVVMQNLAIAFPGKTDAERRKISKAFYHQFVDTFIEVIKMLSMSERDAKRRVTGDYDAICRAFAAGKNIQLHAMHNFNWEIVQWAVASNIPAPFTGVYMPISSKPLDKIFYDLRKRFGTVLIPATRFKEVFASMALPRYTLALAADQNPGNLNSVYWLPFFGKPTAFVAGPEKGARQKNTAVVFVHFYRVKRGYYHFTSELFTMDPCSLPDGTITEQFVRYIERKLAENPANYLWSHRRWKHAWKPEYADRWIAGGQPLPALG